METCKTCKYWRSNYAKGYEPKDDEMWDGECFRFPPVYVAGIGVSFTFPLVTADIYCGEHAQAPNAK